MRKHASVNPNALFRNPINIEDVVTSRHVSSPLHLLDCCVITDGGGAVVVASPEVARNCKQRPVWVLGVGESVAHQGAGKRDLVYIAAKQSQEPAFKMAGVTHEDIDMCMIYDSFTITVLTTLEDLGFCDKGEGGDFVSGGRLQVGGQLPINTDGGGLSSNHPGMRGIFLLMEATRQLRHDFAGTPRQVPGCEIALCHGTGGALGSRHSGGHSHSGEGLDMADWKKPLPRISGETRPYWDACCRGELLIQKCNSCGEYQFYPRGICSNCWTTDIAWFKASGKGTVWTYTVTYQNRTPGFAEEVPYVLAPGGAGGGGPRCSPTSCAAIPGDVEHRDARRGDLRRSFRQDKRPLLHAGVTVGASLTDPPSPAGGS